jgi:WD40 repeat protein
MKTTTIWLLLLVLFACDCAWGQVQTLRSRASSRTSNINARLVVQATPWMINTLNFSPDGESIIVGTMGGATNIENVSADVLDARSGRLIRTIRYLEVDAAKEEAWMEKVAISPDNLMFYGKAEDDFVWDSGSGNLIRKLPKTFSFAAFVPDSKQIYVTTADKLDKNKEIVKVWDL